MNFTTLSQSDASSWIERFRSGAATPVDAYEAAAARIAECEPALNAMTYLSPNARSEAEASARRWREGRPCGQLDGVPVTIKDNLAVAGMPATFGSPAYREFVPRHDELPVARIRAAGAIFLGKTNLPEFALEGYTDNALFGATGNPYDAALTPGGSTGGGAASVAAEYAPIAIGTDGGGSLRRPAAHCGLIALKTTIGRIPRRDGLPQLLFDFEVAGGLTRTLRDTELLYTVMAGPDPLVPASCGILESAAAAGPQRILAVERLGDAPLDPEIARSFRQFADRLASLGHHVRAGTLPPAVDRLSEVWPEIGAIHLARLFSLYPDIGTAASPKYQAIAARGARLPAERVLDMMERVADLRRQVAAAFIDTDVMLTPAIAALAWPKHDTHPGSIDGQKVDPRGHAIYTGWVNAAGVPALALPGEPAGDGRRIGMQMIGNLGTEHRLLALGQEIRRADEAY